MTNAGTIQTKVANGTAVRFANGGTLALRDGGAITSIVVGGAGTDHLNYSGLPMQGQQQAGYASPVSIALSGSAADGFSAGSATGINGADTNGNAFTNIDQLTGSAVPANSDTLSGYDVNATWGLGAAPTRYTADGRALEFDGFENLIGGSGKDAFSLSSAFSANLDGGAGDDRFTFTGNANLTGDILGGDEVDTLTLSDTAQITGAVDLGAGNDELSLNDTATVSGDIEGGAGADTFTGNAANNRFDGGADDDTLNGGDGDDLLIGGPGANTLDGGAGNDTASYENATTAISLNLSTNTNTGDAQGDTFTDIETIAGSPLNDTFSLSSARSLNVDGAGGR